VEEQLIETDAPATLGTELIYGLNDNPPFFEGLFVAFQHVMANLAWHIVYNLST
jgi:hypothetical protein